MFRNFYCRIVSTGIHPGLPFDLRNKLRVFNNANFFIFFITIFYGCIGLINGFWIAVGTIIFSMLSNILSFILVKNGKYNLAFHYTMWYAFSFLTAFSFLFGNTNNSYYYFLFLPVAANILFDKRSVGIVYLIISAILMIGNVYFVETYQPHYHLDYYMRYLSYPNILFAAILIFMGVRLFKVENQKYAAQIEEQNETLEEKNKEITDSINYAKKIQSALIPSETEFNSHFKDSFVLFKPKDIVSGDFYWCCRKGDVIFYATADCTGHGVPGGFMTMLGISLLEQLINEANIKEPAQILDQLREKLIYTLKQSGNAGENKDGMDIVLCRINLKTRQLCYAAGNNSLYVYRDAAFTEYKPDKQPCGFHPDPKPFTQNEIQLQDDDVVYTFTDGFADQFGGPKGKKFKYRNLEQTILALKDQPLSEQKKQLDTVFENWRGQLEQVDDVCIIGVSI